MRQSILSLLVAGVVALFITPTSAHAQTRAFYMKYVGGNGIPQKVDPLLKLKFVVTEATAKTAAYKKARALRIKELAKSVKAIEDKNQRKRTTYYRYRMTPKRREMIADAALYAEEQTGVDAVFMLAVARMESDYRGLTLLNRDCKKYKRGRCYADCGMTQHHVRGSYKYVMRQCKKLVKKPRYSFLKSAQEFARHITWCQDPKRGKRYKPVRRCILNRYNMGPAYRTSYNCIRTYPCHKYVRPPNIGIWPLYYMRLTTCWRVRRKCRSRAAYWKKLTCFEYGARFLVRSKRTCRWCYKLRQISTKYYPPVVAKNLAKPVLPVVPKPVAKNTDKRISVTPPCPHSAKAN